MITQSTFFISTAISVIVSFVLFKLASKYKLALQQPRKRDLHQKPISRLGGLAVVISFFLSLAVVFLLIPGVHADFGFPFAVLGLSIDKRLLGIIIAVIFLSAFMLIDDIKGLPAYTKLAVQILTALILIAAGVGIAYLNNPFGLAIRLDSISWPIHLGADVYHFVFFADMFFIVWFLLFTNATNFIDGLDGLAGSLAFVGAVILGMMSFQVGQISTAILSSVLAGSILGFLFFNLPPAKIFLGDTGSMFLGMMLAVISVITGGKLATVFAVFALVIIDAIYVIIKRILRGKNPLTTPDQTHLHHRFLKPGFSRQSTL
jgi:UDP-GlcNAc:undecaprenyl-phosphate GlcNAc-1-phosphate transferase